VALVVAAFTAGAAQASLPTDRYGFANGCYSLQDQSGQPIAAPSGPFRMHAADLGVYLLYGVHHDFLADPGTGTPTPTAAPSTAAEWTLTGNPNAGYKLKNKATSNVVRATFLSDAGCADFPEASVGAEGQPPRTLRNGRPVYGWADAHMHWMGFELFGGDWHCGRPWSEFGVDYALPDCAQYDQGSNGTIRAFLDGRTPGEPYDSAGWSTFGYWPNPDALAEESTYWTSIERAWLGGLRLLVVQFVDNEALCDVMTTKHLSCNDMNSVRVQNQDLEKLRDYVDAQNGGPGKGWLRIVTTPAQARRAIYQGNLAVVKGIEVSHVLDCGELAGTPQCNASQVDAGLDELESLGITSFFPVHKFDNGFGGTKMDSGEIGYIVNAGNFSKTGHFWAAGPCNGATSDRTQLTTPPSEAAAGIAYQLIGTTLVPVYGPPPHCNARGLTTMGTYLVNQMIDRHMIIEVDHMDEVTADQAMRILGATTPASSTATAIGHPIRRSRASAQSAGLRASTRTRTGARASALTSTASPASPGRLPPRSTIRSDRLTAACTSIARPGATGLSTSTRTASPTTAYGPTGSRLGASAARSRGCVRCSTVRRIIWKCGRPSGSTRASGPDEPPPVARLEARAVGRSAARRRS
jgi:microsomal dipeptidase-like Zn-dependent dipeptidase